MYRVVVFDYVRAYGAWSGNPREIFRSESRAKCRRIEQALRRKARLGVAYGDGLVFVRHVRGSGRGNTCQ